MTESGGHHICRRHGGGFRSIDRIDDDRYGSSRPTMGTGWRAYHHAPERSLSRYYKKAGKSCRIRSTGQLRACKVVRTSPCPCDLRVLDVATRTVRGFRPPVAAHARVAPERGLDAADRGGVLSGTFGGIQYDEAFSCQPETASHVHRRRLSKSTTRRVGCRTRKVCRSSSLRGTPKPKCDRLGPGALVITPTIRLNDDITFLRSVA